MKNKLYDKLVDLVESSRKGPALTKYDVAKALIPFIEKEIADAIDKEREDWIESRSEYGSPANGW